AVRAAAVAARDELRLPDPTGVIDAWLDDPDDRLRRAALHYRLSRPDAVVFTQGVLEMQDARRVRELLEALGDRPRAAAALTPAWLEALLARGAREDRLFAALAIGVMGARAPRARLRAL